MPTHHIDLAHISRKMDFGTVTDILTFLGDENLMKAKEHVLSAYARQL